MEGRRLLSLLGIRAAPKAGTRIVALCLVLGSTAVSVPLRLLTAARWLKQDLPRLTDHLYVASVREDSREFTAAVETLRGAIPPHESYCLVDMSRKVEIETNESYLIRFALAPRKMLFLGEFKQGKKSLRPSSEVPGFLVISAYPDHPPRVVSTEGFFTGLPELPPLKEDVGIPGWLDFPAPGEKVRGAVLEFRGWCQERGGRPCDVRLFLDGEERPPKAGVERAPRPDVQAAVPEIGPAGTAGFRARFELSEAEAGEHHAFALLVTADGRSRRVGPWPFWWIP